MTQTFEENYQAWLNSHGPELKTVFAVLKKRLSDEPELLIKELSEAEQWTARVHYLLAQANSYLDRASAWYLPEKDAIATELSRKTVLESNVAPMREMRDKIEGICTALKTRISLGQSLLKWFTVNHRIGISPTEEKS